MIGVKLHWVVFIGIVCHIAYGDYTTYETTLRTTWHPPTTTWQPPSTTAWRPACNYPYTVIYDRCVLIDELEESDWNEARLLCSKLGGNLVVIDSLEFYRELVMYIYNVGLTSRDYWIGATDELEEGRWKWLNGFPVEMGTPFWAIFFDNDLGAYGQEPTGYTATEDCGYLDRTRFFYMSDGECASMKAKMCQKPFYSARKEVKGSVHKGKKLLNVLKSAKGEP